MKAFVKISKNLEYEHSSSNSFQVTEVGSYPFCNGILKINNIIHISQVDVCCTV